MAAAAVYKVGDRVRKKATKAAWPFNEWGQEGTVVTINKSWSGQTSSLDVVFDGDFYEDEEYQDFDEDGQLVREPRHSYIPKPFGRYIEKPKPNKWDELLELV